MSRQPTTRGTRRAPTSGRLLACLALVWLAGVSHSSRCLCQVASELSFEYLGLVAVPSAQLCPFGSRLHALSLAHNQLERIEPDAFACVAARLKLLNLRRNRIEWIAPDAFRQLGHLQVLLLDGNRIRAMPRALGGLRALRHLNLANNNIDLIGEWSAESGLELDNLISLNLKANPLRRIAASALKSLARLKTLVLSNVQLAGQLEPLEGLAELRFVHLDQSATNSSPLAPDFCRHSRKLASLTLKSNQIERIPQFSNCQALLLIDLSHNRISGAINEHFRRQTDLIDLYLGHNLIEFVEERAFLGLDRLQVLELDHNRLLSIHENAFVPIGSTLLELNIAHNSRLTALPPLGLDKLVSLKAFGNYQLRELPRLKAARLLALTYAYHCCEYAPAAHDQSEVATTWTDATMRQQELASLRTDSLVGQLAESISAKLRHFFAPKQTEELVGDPDDWEPQVDPDNLTELVLWPSAGTRARAARQHKIGAHSQSAIDLGPADTSGGARRRRSRAAPSGARLIDELIWQVRQIRLAHSVGVRVQIGESVEAAEAAGDFYLNLIIAPAGAGVQDQDVDWRTDADTEPDSAADPERRHRPAASLAADRLGRELAAPAQIKRRLGKRQQAPDSGQANKVVCLPQPNAFMPCQDLFDSWWLRASIWLVFSLAFAGNILVIIVLGSVRPSSSHSALTSIMWLAHSKRHIDVPRFLVINLAVADLLMALYLGLLALVDLNTLGEFRLFAIKWQYSNGCKLAGFLAVLSSELSVFILAIITLERNYAITNAVHLNRRLSLQKAMLIMLVGYLFAFGMALLPLNGISDYRKFSICLPLDMESNLGSQIYIITLISINTFSFVLLFSCYMRMYCAIRGSQAWNTNDLRIAKRMSILVLTDFLCWMPIILVGLSSLAGYHLVGPKGLKVLTIFILPLNSVANPFLYAITTKKFKRDLATLRHRFRSLLMATTNCFTWNQNTQTLNYCASHRPNGHQRLTFDPNYHQTLFAHQGGDKKWQKKTSRAKLGGKILNNGQSARRTQLTVAANAKSQHAPTTRLNNTNYQVTLNKTTCSCQQPNQSTQLANERHPIGLSSAEQRVGAQMEVQIDGGSSLVAPPQRACRPRIVLDVVEPALDVVLAPIGLAQVARQAAHSTRSIQTYVSINQPDSHMAAARKCPSQHDGRLFRPQSADADQSQGPQTKLNHLVSCCADQHLSCQAILANEPAQNLDCCNPTDDYPEHGFRSASACGYNWQMGTPGQDDPSAARSNRRRGMCSSCNTVAASVRTAPLSWSIGKLLFGPLAKTWSSIQISLQSINQQARQTSGTATTGQTAKQTERQTNVGATTTPTIDDILQMSSPARRRLAKNNERRMSRSCDMIPHQPHESTISNDVRSSTNEHSSSQYDHFDDQRILLATINRISDQKGGRVGKQERQLNPPSRSKRCRSWSPALLDKLEDCMYQIRSRIPNITLGAGTHQVCHETMEQSEMNDALGNDDDQCTSNKQTESLSRPGDDNHYSDRTSSSSSSSSSQEGDGDIYDGHEDGFNELGLLEWSQRRKRMSTSRQFGRRSRYRLRQQSSTTSDTLSTKTAGTILTNMSVSFESSTNIPGTILSQNPLKSASSGEGNVRRPSVAKEEHNHDDEISPLSNNSPK